MHKSRGIHMRYIGFVLLALILGASTKAIALEPKEVVVIANLKSKASVELAKYYMKGRKIPAANLIIISCTLKERCSRNTYEKEIADPVRKFLLRADFSGRIKCLVLMTGIPLKVEPEKRSQPEISELASVDSEISFLRIKGLRLEGWLPNPHFTGYDQANILQFRSDVLMVSRLDGPDAKTAKRIIDDALRVEKHGLKGIAYFDARYPLLGKDLNTYEKYDLSIRKASEIVRKSGLMKDVVLDTRSNLFQKGQCPDAALYCGWYSLAKYVDAFKWNAGSVGFHIASSECVSLKNPAKPYWCPNMLKHGVCATLGPVAEPYLYAFPDPELFFKYLVEEKKTLVESYFMSQPFVSWRMVLIGDPLYEPFKNRE
ncbi:MAG: TIGR03790 family protein [Pseudomonadota bacterium]